MDINEVLNQLNEETGEFPTPPSKRQRIGTRPSTIREPDPPAPSQSLQSSLFDRFAYKGPLVSESPQHHAKPASIVPLLQSLGPPNALQHGGSKWQITPAASQSFGMSQRQRRSLPESNYFSEAFEPTPPARTYSPVYEVESAMPSSYPPVETTRQKKTAKHRGTGAMQLNHAPMIAQGIPLVGIDQLPDRFRQLFGFPFFNAVQSRSFKTVFGSDDNLVLSAPTGSGKTVVMELAICRLVNTYGSGTYKIIYQAPTKALCSERKRDWEKKMAVLGLTCTELTGDTDQQQLASVKNGDIIITTPEKWDSVTRRWHDHKKLLEMVRLFLIDEVHILKDSRGATLEVVVSRMKSTGTNVRVVALSATVPNSEDIANWLGKSSSEPEIPALQERFGEEFRPVKLQKHVYGYQGNFNDFAFDKSLDKHLPDIIRKHASGKPVMIFCMTRAQCIATAKGLAKLISDGQRLWKSPQKNYSFQDKDLHTLAPCGVAFHNAGLSPEDRTLVERLYIEGELQILCCTSTLAVGVNLPAYLVILKNTVTWSDGGTKEYSDLEVIQMLGRAGRPQFDDTGVAVIMTRREQKNKYEKMVSGQELLESCLHQNLIEHLNAEISLKTITNALSAKRWLQSTFFWVRLRKNPGHYKVAGQTLTMNVNQLLDDLCEKDLKALQQESLISDEGGSFKSTEYGSAMASYYVKFETMKAILALKERAKVSDILTAISRSKEFADLRMRSGEKALLKELNNSTSMKFPVKGDINAVVHKVFILIQSEIGQIEFPPGDPYTKHQSTYKQDISCIFQHIHRIARCIVDCKIYDNDAVAIRSALEVARCAAARCWENSPTQLRQIEGVGTVSVRKLVAANVRSIEDVRKLEAHKIEQYIGRHPPFGMKMLKSIENIPQFRIFAHLVSKTSDKAGTVKVNIRAELGFLNKQTPSRYRNNVIYANFIADTDGVVLNFSRIPVFKLEGGKDIKFCGELFRPNQVINCSIFCEEIVGATASFELKPDIDPSEFPPAEQREVATKPKLGQSTVDSMFQKSSKPGSGPPRKEILDKAKEESEDEYEDLEVAAAMEDLDFSHLDSFAANIMSETAKNTAMNSNKSKPKPAAEVDEQPFEPVRLPNGKWECKHKCADKTSCKHLCCHEGMDNPPKMTKKKVSASAGETPAASQKKAPNSSQAPASGKAKLSQLPQSSQRPSLYAPRMALEAAVKRADNTLIASDEAESEGTSLFPQSAKSNLKKLDRLHKKVGASTISTLRTVPGQMKEKGDVPSFLDGILKEKLPFHNFDKQLSKGKASPGKPERNSSRIAGDSGTGDEYGLNDLDDDDIEELDLPVVVTSDASEPSEDVHKAPVAPRRLPTMTREMIRQQREKRKAAVQSDDYESDFYKSNRGAPRSSPPITIVGTPKKRAIPEPSQPQLSLFFSTSSSSPTIENQQPTTPKQGKAEKKLRFALKSDTPSSVGLPPSPTYSAMDVVGRDDPDQEDFTDNREEEDFIEDLQLDPKELEEERLGVRLVSNWDEPVEDMSRATVKEVLPRTQDFPASEIQAETEASKKDEGPKKLKVEDEEVDKEILDFLGDCVEFLD